MSSGFIHGIEPSAPPSLDAHWFLFEGRELLVIEASGGGAAPARPSQVPEEAHYLGQLEGRACFAARAAASEVDGAVPMNLRAVWGPLPEALWWVAGTAVQILEWDRTHRFCGACGAPTARAPGERARRCEACRLSFYPRVSPAVICIVRRGDEALLARARAFARDFYSTLAGFVEPGETLEEALAREIREEVGLEIQNARYFGSQPWPFPHSLMVGFTAEWASGEIRADGREILDAQWFRPDALPNIPPRLSISRRLIDWWIEQARPS